MSDYAHQMRRLGVGIALVAVLVAVLWAWPDSGPTEIERVQTHLRTTYGVVARDGSCRSVPTTGQGVTAVLCRLPEVPKPLEAALNSSGTVKPNARRPLSTCFYVANGRVDDGGWGFPSEIGAGSDYPCGTTSDAG